MSEEIPDKATITVVGAFELDEPIELELGEYVFQFDLNKGHVTVMKVEKWGPEVLGMREFEGTKVAERKLKNYPKRVGKTAKRLNEKRFHVGGKLFGFFQKEKGGEVYYCCSEDSGQTWSKPEIAKLPKEVKEE